MDQLKIGDPNCTFTMVISAMSNSHQFEELENQWKEVATRLSLPNEFMQSIEDRLRDGDYSATDITFWILKTWRCCHERRATLQKLVDVLKNCGLVDLSEKIKASFLEDHPSPVPSQVQADSRAFGITDSDWDIRTFKFNETSTISVKRSNKENNLNENKGNNFMNELINNKKAYELQGPIKNEPGNGYALILNIIQYNTQGYRQGAQYDSHILNQLLTQLGYEVAIFSDPSNCYEEKEIKEIIEKFRDHIRYKNPKSIIVYIGCHGVNDRIITSKDDAIDENLMDFKKTIVNRFGSNEFKELRDVPKIFFAQFCRGVDQHDGISGDLIENAVVCYATSKGNLAFRHPDEGSYFVKHLAQQVSQYAHNTHLTHLLDMTCEALKKQPIDYNGNQVTQVCEYKSSFVKKLYFKV